MLPDLRFESEWSLSCGQGCSQAWDRGGWLVALRLTRAGVACGDPSPGWSRFSICDRDFHSNAVVAGAEAAAARGESFGDCSLGVVPSIRGWETLAIICCSALNQNSRSRPAGRPAFSQRP